MSIFDPGYMKSLFPEGNTKRVQQEPKEPTQKWLLYGTILCVYANTKSEARSLFKKELGVKKLEKVLIVKG